MTFEVRFWTEAGCGSAYTRKKSRFGRIQRTTSWTLKCDFASGAKSHFGGFSDSAGSIWPHRKITAAERLWTLPDKWAKPENGFRNIPVKQGNELKFQQKFQFLGFGTSQKQIGGFFSEWRNFLEHSQKNPQPVSAKFQSPNIGTFNGTSARFPVSPGCSETHFRLGTQSVSTMFQNLVSF